MEVELSRVDPVDLFLKSGPQRHKDHKETAKGKLPIYKYGLLLARPGRNLPNSFFCGLCAFVVKFWFPNERENANQYRFHRASIHTIRVWLPIGGRRYAREGSPRQLKLAKNECHHFLFHIFFPVYQNITAMMTTLDSQRVRIKQDGIARIEPRSESLMIRVNALLSISMERQIVTT